MSPNSLSFLRIALAPVLVILFYMPESLMSAAQVSLWCAIVYGIAAISDWLDGYWARSADRVTRFGTFLDPVADKIIVVVALVLLVERHASALITLPALIIIFREVSVSAMREWMATMGQRDQIAVTTLSKWKTACQLVAILVLLGFHPGLHPWINSLGIALLYIATWLTVQTVWHYMVAVWPWRRQE